MRARTMLTVAVMIALSAGCATTSNQGVPEIREGCDQLEFDVLTGHINGLTPQRGQDTVKRVLPCFTGDTADGSDYNYGGGVFYIKHSFFFYTGRDFIEIRAGFKGTETYPMLGKPLSAATARLGKALYKKGIPGTSFHETSYGCAHVETEDGVISQVAAHAQSCADVMSWYHL